MSVGALLIPAAAWAGWYRLARELAARGALHPDRRLAALIACTAWAVQLTVITELAGLFHSFDAATLRGAWLISGAVLYASAGLLARARGALSLNGAWAEARRAASRAWTETPLDARLFVAATVLIVAALGALAWLTPSTNFDSMTYHLARVMHWIEQRSVDHFATTNWRQLDFGPWPGFTIAHLYLLAGDDRFANLVQWTAMVLSVVGASLIARMLLPGWTATSETPDPKANGTRARASALAALLVATIPIGIGEAVTTQTDYVAAAWLATSAAFALALYHAPGNVWYAAGFGGAVGLGLLTKSTAALFAAPWAVAVAVLLLVRVRGVRRYRALAVVVVLVVGLNAPHLARNWALYGSPMGTAGATSLLVNTRVSVSGTASNLIRNLSLYTATGIAPVTAALGDLAMFLHSLTGRDRNDPELTFPYAPFTIIDRFEISDSVANSAYHPALIALALILLVDFRPPRSALLAGFAGISVLGLVLFCALLRWQPWHGRFHLSLFVVLMPFAAVVLASTTHRWIVAFLAAGFLALGVTCVLYSRTRPVIAESNFLSWPREEQYFLARREHYPAFRALADAVAESKCETVGLHLQFDDWEYPFWMMLKARGFHGQIYNVGVSGITAALAPPRPVPCAVITTQPTRPPALAPNLATASAFGGLRVWWRTPRPG